MNKFLFFISFRYFSSIKKARIVSIISLLSILGVGLGTMAMIIVMSVFNGFDKLISSLYSTFDPDIKIVLNEGKFFSLSAEKLMKIKSLDNIAVVSLCLEEEALVRYGDKHQVVSLKGVDKNFYLLTRIDTSAFAGSYMLSRNDYNFANIGWGISHNLSISLDYITPLFIYIPNVNSSNLTIDDFNGESVIPSSIFATQPEIDSKYIIVSIDFIRSMMGIENNKISSLEIRVKNKNELEDSKQKIKNILKNKNFLVQNMTEQHQMLFKVINSEKWVVLGILLFFAFLLSFNIIGSLTMLILEKERDMAILNGLGVNNISLRKIFILNGLFIVIFGIIFGVFLGYIFCYLQGLFGFLALQANNIVQAYPVKMLLSDFIIICLSIFFIGFLSCLYSTRKLN